MCPLVDRNVLQSSVNKLRWDYVHERSKVPCLCGCDNRSDLFGLPPINITAFFLELCTTKEARSVCSNFGTVAVCTKGVVAQIAVNPGWARRRRHRVPN